jgi:hypothetical protein
MDDEFSKLSPEDQAKLALLVEEYERDGDAAFDRFIEKETITLARLIEILRPGALKRALENHFIDEGMTDAEVRIMLEKALQNRKH